jgi:hypothetical protein
MSDEDRLIEEGAMIWLRERDGLPTTIWRCRFRQMAAELFAQIPTTPTHECRVLTHRMPDRKCLAAGDDTWTPDPELTTYE